MDRPGHHRAAKSDCGTVRDGVFAEQVVELFDELGRARREGPWLAVASFVNPHDIAFSGFGWEQLLGFDPPDGTVPEIPEAPSQGDSFAGPPPCQEAFKALWPKMIFESARTSPTGASTTTPEGRRRVHRADPRGPPGSGMFDDTIVVFTSDHGDLIGAHGGLVQKWFNVFDEATRVPLLVSGRAWPESTAGSRSRQATLI